MWQCAAALTDRDINLYQVSGIELVTSQRSGQNKIPQKVIYASLPMLMDFKEDLFDIPFKEMHHSVYPALS